jgi:hypothetical protein
MLIRQLVGATRYLGHLIRSGPGLKHIFPFGIPTRRCKLHLLAVIQIEQDSIYNNTKQAKPECRDVNIISRIVPQSTT